MTHQPDSNNEQHSYSAELAIIAPWIPLVPHDQTTNTIHMGLLNPQYTKFGEQFIVEYLRLVWPYLDVLGYKDQAYREADAPASGVVFFYGCLMYIVHFPNWGDYVPDIVSYNLMYQLVDHYLDDDTISSQQRITDLQSMWKMLDDPAGDYSHCSTDLRTLANVYHQLIQRRPQCQAAVKSLFTIELKSVQVQKSSEHQRSDYYQLALTKGARTMEVLGAIMEVSTPEQRAAVSEIGHIMQLVDDCMDVFADKQKGINTTATHDLAHAGNLDLLWSDIVARIGQLPSSMNVFKIIYSIFAVYLPDRVEVFSPQLRSFTHQYNWCRFDGSGLLTGAVERVIDQLLSGKKVFDGAAEDLPTTITLSLTYLKGLYASYMTQNSITTPPLTVQP